MPRKRKQSKRGLSSAGVPSQAETISFADMYDLHVEEVYQFVHRRCRDHQLAQDITQETFLRAVQKATDPGSLSVGWLVTVARNLLYDVLRRNDSLASKLRLLGPVAPDEQVVDLVERLRVEAALQELSVDQRLVLTLHYLDGLTVPAMAAHLDRSPKSVEGHLTRARRAFRSKLEDGTPEITERGSNG